mmetsp:Transcript_66828/g.111819  ORF Transcript_66828/g.111819 Transcript_66828/m.111819 type:complete len:120 (+) Transcript_66828:484-843(+)
MLCDLSRSQCSSTQPVAGSSHRLSEGHHAQNKGPKRRGCSALNRRNVAHGQQNARLECRTLRKRVAATASRQAKALSNGTHKQKQLQPGDKHEAVSRETEKATLSMKKATAVNGDNTYE